MLTENSIEETYQRVHFSPRYRIAHCGSSPQIVQRRPTIPLLTFGDPAQGVTVRVLRVKLKCQRRNPQSPPRVCL